jgi:hypothetical protein
VDASLVDVRQLRIIGNNRVFGITSDRVVGTTDAVVDPGVSFEAQL